MNRTHGRGTPNGINLTAALLIDSFMWRSDDGLVIALHEPSSEDVQKAIEWGAWFVFGQSPKTEGKEHAHRWVIRAGRILKPDVWIIMKRAVQDQLEPEFENWFKVANRAERDFRLRFSDETSLAEQAAAFHIAWKRHAAAVLKKRREQYGDNIPVRPWLKPGLDELETSETDDEVDEDDA